MVQVAVPGLPGVKLVDSHPSPVSALHATVPVTDNPFAPVTVAVHVTDTPKSDGFGLHVTAVVVVPLVDFSATVFWDALAAGQPPLAGQVAVRTQVPLAPVIVTTSPLMVHGPVAVMVGVGVVGENVTVNVLPMAASVGAPVKVYGPHTGGVVESVKVTSVIPVPMVATTLLAVILPPLAGG